MTIWTVIVAICLVVLYSAVGIGLSKLIDWSWYRKHGRHFFSQEDIFDGATIVLIVMIWPVVLVGIILMKVFGFIAGIVWAIGDMLIEIVTGEKRC